MICFEVFHESIPLCRVFSTILHVLMFCPPQAERRCVCYTGCPRKNALLSQILCKSSSLQTRISLRCMHSLLGFWGSNEK